MSFATVSAEETASGPGIPNPLTIDVAAQMATTARPDLAAQHARVEAARQRPAQARALSDPMFMTGIYKLPVDFMGVDYMFQLSQSFPLSRRLANQAEAADSVAAAEQENWEALKLDRELAARLAFVDLWEWDQTILALEQSLPLLQANVELARRRYGVGAAGQGDVLRAETELAGLRATITTARANRDAAAAALLASIGLDVGGSDLAALRLGTPPEPHRGASLETLLATALRRRPELRRIAAEERAATATGEAARSEYMPEAEVQVGYMLSTMEPDSYQAMIGVGIPLGVGWRRAAVAEADARARAARLDAAALRLEIRREVTTAHAGLQAAMVSRAALSDEVLPRAEAAVRALSASYAAGEGSLSALLDAQRTLINARLQFEQTRANAFRKHAELRRAVAADPDPAD